MGLSWAESVETKMQKKANKSDRERSGSTEAKIFLSIFTVAKVKGADHGRNEKWVSAHAVAAEERGGGISDCGFIWPAICAGGSWLVLSA